MLNNNTLADMARYLKTLLPPRVSHPSVQAFRDFMVLLYDLLFEDSKKYDKPNKTPSLSIAVDFPFIYHIRSVLLNIGYHGELQVDTLSFGGLKTLAPIICCEGMESSSKISIPKLEAYLEFLNECGMYFHGEVTYPDNPAVLEGLKIMATAQRDKKWKTNDEIFLRCDYCAVCGEKINIDGAINDFAAKFAPETRDEIVHMHQNFIAQGLKCTVRIGLKNSFQYKQSGKIVHEIANSFATGLIIK